MINGSKVNDATAGGFVAFDEEWYQLWLRNPTSQVAHIVLLGYNGDSAAYPDWTAYTAKLSDFPLAGYQDVVKSIPSFTRAISDTFAGAVSQSIGSLVLDNTDGALDQWPNLAFDGQPVRIYQGDPAWSVSRFRLIQDCIAEACTGADQDSITIRLRGLEHGANEPIQTSLIPANVNATAPSNQPIPLAFGNVFNITPAVIDEANQIYQWNDGAVTAVTEGRDDGSPFQTNQIAISAVNLGSPANDLLSTDTAHGFYVNTRVRCDVGTLPASASWYGITWNGRIFCAVAVSTAIAATSPDGISWTQRTLPASTGWTAIAWNGDVFCAVAVGSSIAATSPDGITWTQRTLPASGNWAAICWNGEVFAAVAGGFSGYAATSPDGINWTSHSISSLYDWAGLAWNGTVFCAVASASADKCATSQDGITWILHALPISETLIGIAWNGDVFCAVATGTTYAITSPDGVTWTLGVLPSASQWWGVSWNGDVFCATSIGTSSAAATSPDGITWTARTFPVASDWYGIASNGALFCVIGAATNYVTTSADGATWTGVVNTLPAPLAINTDYWVHPDDLSATDFKLSATRGGSILALSGTDTGALLVGYHWTADLTTGKVYLDSKPSGVFTMDGTAGSTAAATILPTVLNAINVDTDAQTAFAITCAQPIGIYVGERRNRLDVAADIMAGLGAWYGYDRYSFLRMGRVEGTYTTHDYELIQDEMDDGSLVIEKMILPAKRHRIGYRKNWTDQNGKLVAGISTEKRGLYSTPYSVSAPELGDDEGPADEEFHLLAAKPDVIESMMTYGYDALIEAERRNGMFYGWGAIFRCTVGLVGSEMNPGDVVKVTHARYGLDAGVRMALVSVEDRPTDCKTVLKFFAALSAYAPGQL